MGSTKGSPEMIPDAYTCHTAHDKLTDKDSKEAGERISASFLKSMRRNEGQRAGKGAPQKRIRKGERSITPNCFQNIE